MSNEHNELHWIHAQLDELIAAAREHREATEENARRLVWKYTPIDKVSVRYDAIERIMS